ncbi:hypothetical protein FRB93_010134 [Tulasnella sp. JGI-2019a]|nr:hypothetical protein FRB93_010134 [Tulasnella sp. JGI-2019a]
MPLLDNFTGQDKWLVKKYLAASHADLSGSSSNFHIILPTSSGHCQPLLVTQDHQKGTVLGYLVDPKGYLDQPCNGTKYHALDLHAAAIGKVIHNMSSYGETGLEETGPSSTATANNEKDEEWGPQTGEAPNMEILPSIKLCNLLDWGPKGPDWAREHLFKITEQNIEAFGFDRHLRHNPTKVHIHTKEDQALLSQPMYHTSPAK